MRKKILTIIGARPQIIKAASLSRVIRNHFDDRLSEVIVHTGQHYDDNMSRVFFDELKIPNPDYNLNVGSNSHGKQTATMIEKIEEVLLKEKPELVVLYGDTNSTLSGSIAASKVHIPIVHIEAGLRSFNKTMPEEINRVVCDHTSTLLFSPTLTGLNNLISEGFHPHNNPPFTNDNPGIFHCGDVMFDNTLYFSKMSESNSDIFRKYNLVRNNYILGTVHRNNNTDDPERLNSIFNAIHKITKQNNIDIILPLHPRTSKILHMKLNPDLHDLVANNPHIKITPPASYFDIIELEKNCKLVITDSGGVQKEAYFFQKPVIVLRPETEWVEIIENGTGIISNSDTDKIIEAYQYFDGKDELEYPSIFGDGRAAEFICQKLLDL